MDPKLLANVLPLVIMVAFFYFALIRPQKKKEQQVKSMRDGLKVGDQVLTIGGIRGKVIIVKEDYVTIETSGLNTRMELAKWGINSVVNETGK